MSSLSPLFSVESNSKAGCESEVAFLVLNLIFSAFKSEQIAFTITPYLAMDLHNVWLEERKIKRSMLYSQLLLFSRVRIHLIVLFQILYKVNWCRIECWTRIKKIKEAEYDLGRCSCRNSLLRCLRSLVLFCRISPYKGIQLEIQEQLGEDLFNMFNGNFWTTL